MNRLNGNDTAVASNALHAVLARMKQAQLDAGPASAELRVDRIDRALRLLVDNHSAIADTVSVDFGNRSRQQSLLADICSAVDALKHSREHVREWMKPEPRPAPFPGTEARIEYQPLGVIGIVSP